MSNQNINQGKESGCRGMYKGIWYMRKKEGDVRKILTILLQDFPFSDAELNQQFS